MFIILALDNTLSLRLWRPAGLIVGASSSSSRRWRLADAGYRLYVGDGRHLVGRGSITLAPISSRAVQPLDLNTP